MRPTVQFVQRTGLIDLAWGHPLPQLLPVDEWAAAGARAGHEHGWRMLAYGYAAGPAPLLDWLRDHLAALEGGPGPAPEQCFVTAGASHALSLVAEVLTEPGDTVLVDAPTYHLALRILANRGVRLLRAPADADGLDPEALAVRLDELDRAGRRAPLLYLVPTFGNPTGHSLPADRRAALVRLAQRTGLTVVEDDTYRELAYDGPAPPALWQLSGGHGVVRIGSFAKTVAPGLRLGWINAAPKVVRRLTALGYVDSGGGVNHATAMTMAAFGGSGAYAAHVAAVRDRYRVQRDTLAAALGVPRPAGGWFLWLPLPAGLTAAALLPVAERHGTSFVEGSRFYCDGRGGTDRIRLSFSHYPPAELTEAARRLTAARAEADRLVQARPLSTPDPAA